MRINKVGILLSSVFIGLSIWILVTQWSSVWPNLEASFIWVVPSFVTSHLILHKKINNVHETLKEQNKNDN